MNSCLIALDSCTLSCRLKVKLRLNLRSFQVSLSGQPHPGTFIIKRVNTKATIVRLPRIRTYGGRDDSYQIKFNLLEEEKILLIGYFDHDEKVKRETTLLIEEEFGKGTFRLGRVKVPKEVNAKKFVAKLLPRSVHFMMIHSKEPGQSVLLALGSTSDLPDIDTAALPNAPHR